MENEKKKRQRQERVAESETDTQKEKSGKRCETDLAITLPGLDELIDLHRAFDGHAETVHDAPIAPTHCCHSAGCTAPLLLNRAHAEHAAPFGFSDLHRLRLPTIQGGDMQQFDVLLFG